jgi:hypothetical protein
MISPRVQPQRKMVGGLNEGINRGIHIVKKFRVTAIFFKCYEADSGILFFASFGGGGREVGDECLESPIMGCSR